MDDEKRWQDMNADEQAKRITELAGALGPVDKRHPEFC
jgi:hypothetical protein